MRIMAILLSLMFSMVIPAGATEKAEQKIYKVRWVLAHEPVRVFERAARHFADEVKKQTDGNIQIEIIDGKTLNSGQTMSADQAFAMVKDGKIEMTQTYTTYLGNHSAPFWALDLPFLFKNHEHAARVLQGPIGKEILSGLQASNIDGLAFTYSGGYMIVPTAKQEIHTIEDFKGLRVSVNNNSPVGTALMKNLGAIPVATQSNEAKDLDGFETTYARFVELKPETQNGKKVINDLQHSLFLTAILINKPFFESLPLKYQTVIQNAARTAATLEREDSIKDGLATKQQVIGKGFKVISMSPDQITRFKNSVGPIYAKFEPMLGKDLIQRIQKN